jgi:hypothetical protein
MAIETVSQHFAQEVPPSTREAALSKRCRIHFCTPVTSGLDEREWWMVQQGSSMKFIATLPEVVKYIEDVAPMKPMVMKSVNIDVENAGRDQQ